MLMSLNIQSLPTKFNEFSPFINELFFQKCAPDIIALQELWQLNDASIYKLNGYQKLVFKSRAAKIQGGGVGLYIKNDIKYLMRPDLSIFIDKVFESLFIEIVMPKGKNIIIGSIYRPNSATANFSSTEQLTIFNDNLTNILSNINDLSLNAYLLGDFNIDVLKLDSHGPTAEYIENIFSLGYLQLITNPTRCAFGSATLIDHIIINKIQHSSESGIIVNRISDHFPIFHVLPLTRPKLPNKFYHSRDFSANNVATFNNSLQQLGWGEVLDSGDTQQCANIFFSQFTDLFNLHFPLLRKQFNKNFNKIERWMTNGLLNSRRTKLKLCYTSVKIPTTENITKFKMYRNLYN